METMLHAGSLIPTSSLHARQLSVLYDVQRYTHHTWRDRWQIPSSLPPRTANRLLLAHLDEGVPIVHDTMLGRTAALCLEHWDHLPIIVYLLGAHTLREWLVGTGRVTLLRMRAADFLHLPLPRYRLHDSDALQSRLSTNGPTDELVYAAGVAVLMSAWGGHDKSDVSIRPIMHTTDAQQVGAGRMTRAASPLSPHRAIYRRLRLLLPETSLRACPHLPLRWGGPSSHALFLIKSAIAHWSTHVQKDCETTWQ